MKKFFLLILVSLSFGIAAFAQTGSIKPTPVVSPSPKPKKVIFRATKDQVKEAQTKLKDANLYAGEITGKRDTATKTAIKSWQKDNGLKQTGTLNRATLEKFGVELTDKQKLIPVSPSSYATTEPKEPKPPKTPKTPKPTSSSDTSTSTGPMRGPIFRATVDQIKAAQKMLKEKSMYAGEEDGKLNDATRAGLKKFQDASGMKVTGTLNAATLEKMGIPLTDKQKADEAKMSPVKN